MTNIINFREREKKISALRNLKRNKVVTYGHFSSIHPGHIRYLQNAKSLGEILITVLRGDKDKKEEEKYAFSIEERSKSLAMLNICDYVIHLKNDEINELVNLINPSTLVFGTDYKYLLFEEIKETIDLAKNKNIDVIFNSGDVNYSTSELLESSTDELDVASKKLFFNSCKKQNIDLKELSNKISELKETPILIIGDTIIDEYTACEALGMSAEAPVLVVKELESKMYCGGAAVVASHIKNLGGNCFFATITGDDKHADFLEKDLNEKSIINYVLRDKSRPTTYKKRYMVDNQKLFRVSKLEDEPLSKDLENEFIENILKIIPKVKGIVISDFSYGLITEKILETIIECALRSNIKLFADSQCSSQLGSITKFQNYTLLCPNEKEARFSLQNKFSGLESLVNELFKISNPKNIILKLGKQGFIAYQKKSNGKVFNQHFPALSSNPIDVAGAGDSLLACMSLAISSGVNFMDAAALSSFMCMIAVESMGNKSITNKQLVSRISQFLNSSDLELLY